MKLHGRLPFRMAILALPLMMNSVMATGPSDDLSQAYCSNENTGSDYSPQSNIYMSMGKCFDQCKADYAFAVVQYKTCWCSNYAPASTEDVSQCSQTCPGYPDEQCGNENDGLFGYIPLSKAPSGTAGAPASTQPASSSPPQTSYEPQTTYVSRTVTQTVTNEDTQGPSVVTSYVTPTPSFSSIPITSSSSSTSSEPPITSSSAKPSPVTTVRTTTVSGNIVTQTVTETPTPVVVAPSNASDSVQMRRKGLSGGAIAGVVLGVLLGLAALALAAFLLWRRRKHEDAEGAGGATKSPKRNTSVLSRTGLLGGARPQSMAENTYDDPPVYSNVGGNSVRHSMMFGAAATAEGVSPVSPLGGSQDNVSSRRHSKPMVYDQRLNPSALFANPELNNSRVSMQDQQDYSRPLGITNPDWRASFDSR